MEKSLYEKLFANAVRKMVFERLGTLKKSLFEEAAKGLTEEEKHQLAHALIGVTEQACKEFILEMQERLDKKKPR